MRLFIFIIICSSLDLSADVLHRVFLNICIQQVRNANPTHILLVLGQAPSHLGHYVRHESSFRGERPAVITSSRKTSVCVFTAVLISHHSHHTPTLTQTTGAFCHTLPPIHTYMLYTAWPKEKSPPWI